MSNLPLRRNREATEEEVSEESSSEEEISGCCGKFLHKKEIGEDEFDDDPVWQDHQTAWKAMKNKLPGEEVIFGHIEISMDGGLGEISARANTKEDRLWYNTRPLSTLLAFFFMFYNCYFIINNAKTVIYGHEVSWADFRLSHLKDIFNGSAEEQQDYLVSTYLVGWLLKSLHPETEWDSMLSCFVVVLEVTMLVYMWLYLLFRLVVATLFAGLCCSSLAHLRWQRWLNVAQVYFITLPSLQSYSAMRLLNYIVPQVASQDLFTVLFYIQEYKAFWLVWFAASRVFCLIVGLDCFLIKYRGVEFAILNQPDMNKTNVMNAIIFLNQVLGVVQLKWAVRDRLYRFVFAGEDGIMTSSEMVRRDIWEARMCKRICETYSRFKAFSILMTWNDDDFQGLVLNDVPLAKRRPTPMDDLRELTMSASG